jgi:hypothetical protein
MTVFPPWLEGRGIHRGEGKLVLTLVATGRSAGVGEEEWCVLAGVEGDDGAVLLTVDYRIKVHIDLQADKSPVVVKGPFFPRVVNPRYRIRGTMCNARIQSSKARKAIY